MSSSSSYDVMRLEITSFTSALLDSDDARLLPAQSLSGLQNTFRALVESAHDAESACDTAQRIFSRAVGITSLKSAGTPTPAVQRDSDARTTASAQLAEPSSKRFRSGDENFNPADQGASLLHRHEQHLTAAVDKYFFGKCPAEGQVFSPILVHVRDLQAQLFADIAKLASTIVDLPEGDFGDLPTDCIRTAPRKPGLTSGNDTEDGSELSPVEVLVQRLAACHTTCKDLHQLYAHAMRCYWLANHTEGANWNTVKQILFRDQVDRQQAMFSANPIPEKSWDEKVVIAMKRIDQSRGLAKDGSLLGPICPDLARGDGRQDHRPQANRNGRGRCGGGGQGSRGGRFGSDGRNRQNAHRGQSDRSRNGRNGSRDDRGSRGDGRKDQGSGGDRSRTDAGSDKP